ncbi:MAG: hypothetical protein LBV78_04675, partial [Kitasatospora sp.]|nr:hypothetical protein [Kitasatospora sp.]
MIANLAWAWRKILRPESGVILVLTVLYLIANVLPAFQPVISRTIVDDLVGESPVSVLWLPGLLMCLTFLLPGPVDRMGDLPRAALEERTVRRLDELVIEVGQAIPDGGSLERPDIHDRIRHARDQNLMLARLPYLGLGVLSQAAGILTLLITLGSLAWWL